MDELTLLRHLRSTDEITDDAFAERRALLLRQVTSEPPVRSNVTSISSRKLSRRPILVGMSVAAAFAIVAGTIAFGIGPTGGASAQAAVVLNAPAKAAEILPDPILGAGQYLAITTVAETLSYAPAPADQDPNGENRSPAYLAPSRQTLYVPANRDDQWAEVRTYPRPTILFGDDATRAAALQGWAESIRSGAEKTRHGSADSFAGGASIDAVILALPLDPAALVKFLYATRQGGSASADEDAMVRISDILRTRLAPADKRAALFRALALIPGVEITKDQATLNGQVGVALGRQESSRDFRHEIIVDPKTGNMIGERIVLTKSRGDIPDGTIIESTSVSASVVDSAP